MKLMKQLTLHRTTSSRSTHQLILHPNYNRSSSSISSSSSGSPKTSSLIFSTSQDHSTSCNNINILIKVFQSIRNLISTINPIYMVPSCPGVAGNTAIATTLGRKVTGTLFGSNKGHVTFTVQDHPRSDPLLVLELATSTRSLVKEMASGLVRIALECENSGEVEGIGAGGGWANKKKKKKKVRLFEEPRWSMYCNGKKWGRAVTRKCGEVDWHVLSTLQTVTVGAGVIPVEEAQIVYMRARFERVVGGCDLEAYHMMNPDRTGGVELSIFLLRI